MGIAWQRTGYMHEKYDVFEPGKFGMGGEYSPQVGFGWTNGVALACLVRKQRVELEKDTDTVQARVPSCLRSPVLSSNLAMSGANTALNILAGELPYLQQVLTSPQGSQHRERPESGRSQSGSRGEWFLETSSA